ncbi:MAG: hypothetical protein O3A00_24960, partial [Planctomycetota bacterium]|nr:hypothetical protein [Planctomycetota bacterium]
MLIVETAGLVFFRQQVHHFDLGAKQVAQGCFVFRAVQASQADASFRQLKLPRRRMQMALQRLREDLPFRVRRRRFAGRRHLLF